MLCIAETHFPAFVREDSTTYYFAVAPEYIADSTLELAERYINEIKDSGGLHAPPLPAPDGIDNVFPLREFAPKAILKKTVPTAK